MLSFGAIVVAVGGRLLVSWLVIKTPPCIFGFVRAGGGGGRMIVLGIGAGGAGWSVLAAGWKNLGGIKRGVWDVLGVGVEAVVGGFGGGCRGMWCTCWCGGLGRGPDVGKRCRGGVLGCWCCGATPRFFGAAWNLALSGCFGVCCLLVALSGCFGVCCLLVVEADGGGVAVVVVVVVEMCWCGVVDCLGVCWTDRLYAASSTPMCGRSSSTMWSQVMVSGGGVLVAFVNSGAGSTDRLGGGS